MNRLNVSIVSVKIINLSVPVCAGPSLAMNLSMDFLTHSMVTGFHRDRVEEHESESHSVMSDSL